MPNVFTFDPSQGVPGGVRTDSQEGYFLDKELTHTLAEAFKAPRPKLFGLENFPVDQSVPFGKKKVRYKLYDSVGKAQFLGDYAKDLTQARVFGTDDEVPYVAFGVALLWTLEELEAAQAADAPGDFFLDNVLAARRAVDELVNDTVWFGSQVNGLKGVLSFPNFDGPLAAANPLSSDSTPDQCVAVLNGAVNGVVEATRGVERPTRLLVALDSYNHLATTRFSDSSDKTVLEYFLATNPYCKEVVGVPELQGASLPGEAGTTDVLLAYTPDRSKLRFHVSPLRELNTLELNGGLAYVKPLVGKVSSLVAPYPKSVRVVKGV